MRSSDTKSLFGRTQSSWKRGVVGIGGSLLLAACASTPDDVGRTPNRAPPVETTSVAPPAAQPGASLVTKDGLTPPFMADRSLFRVGILLPFASREEDASALYHGAELAVFDFGNPATLLIPHESGTTAEESKAATDLLLRQGADVILGPFENRAVPGAAEAARSKGVPVVAFSSDSLVAGGGAYLLSIPLEEDVRRIARYAVANNMRRVALLAAEGDYGRRVEAALRGELTARGATLVTSEFYAQRTPAAADAAARKLAERLRATPVNAILIPDNGPVLSAGSAGLLAGGVNLGQSGVRLLGTGAWAQGDAITDPTLVGGLYPAPDPSARADFERRYAQAYGRPPSRAASYGYDAVMTAIQIAEGSQGQVTASGLERQQGFRGADGVFRFRPNGTIERGLAVLEVRQNGTRVADPAPKSFTGS